MSPVINVPWKSRDDWLQVFALVKSSSLDDWIQASHILDAWSASEIRHPGPISMSYAVIRAKIALCERDRGLNETCGDLGVAVRNAVLIFFKAMQHIAAAFPLPERKEEEDGRSPLAELRNKVAHCADLEEMGPEYGAAIDEAFSVVKDFYWDLQKKCFEEDALMSEQHAALRGLYAAILHKDIPRVGRELAGLLREEDTAGAALLMVADKMFLFPQKVMKKSCPCGFKFEVSPAVVDFFRWLSTSCGGNGEETCLDVPQVFFSNLLNAGGSDSGRQVRGLQWLLLALAHRNTSLSSSPLSSSPLLPPDLFREVVPAFRLVQCPEHNPTASRAMGRGMDWQGVVTLLEKAQYHFVADRLKEHLPMFRSEKKETFGYEDLTGCI